MIKITIISVLACLNCCLGCPLGQNSPFQTERLLQHAEVILGPSKPSGKLEHDPVSSVSTCELLSLIPRDEGFPPEQDLCDVYTYGSAAPTYVLGSMALVVPLTVTQRCTNCQAMVSILGRWHCPNNNTKIRLMVDGQPPQDVALRSGLRNSLIFTTEINATSSLGLLIPEPFSDGLRCISELSLLWGDESGITSGYTVEPIIPTGEQLENLKKKPQNKLDVLQDNIQVLKTSNERPTLSMKKTSYNFNCESSDSPQCKWTTSQNVNDVQLEAIQPTMQGRVGAGYNIRLKSMKMGQKHVVVKVCQEGSFAPDNEHACSFLIDLQQGRSIIGRGGECKGLSFDSEQKGIFIHQKQKGHLGVTKLYIEAVGNGIEDIVVIELPPRKPTN
ncbi:hypothetical protein [Marmot herpesvirus 1]|nr:hypothetical protein [Marmot herpesvirus 1]